MVFQSGLPVTLKGKCSSNGKLAVLIENVCKVVEADEYGAWSVSFPELDYKGNFDIRVEGKNGEEVLLENAITGNVWLVIGDNWMSYDQDNFTNTVQSGAFNEDVRYFQPEVRASSFGIENSSWKVLSPGSIYSYEKLTRTLGERLQENSDTPIGIINLSWPATHIADFATNKPDVFKMPSEIEYINYHNIYDSISLVQQFINDSSFRGIEKGALDLRLEDWDWNDLNLPEKAGKKWYLKDRIVWLRRKFYVSDKYRTGDFKINMGTIRGGFIFYLNGTEIDRFEGEDIDYSIPVPDSILRTWSNLLTIRMNTADSLSGFYSDKMIVANQDLSYNVNIIEDWVYKGFLEPRIPKNTLPIWSYPRIYDNIIPEIGSGRIYGVVVSGGYSMYSDCSSSLIQEGLENLNKQFISDYKLICLPTKISYIDSLEQKDYYLDILNSQLNASAKAGYTLVNLSDIESPQSNDYSIIEITERMIDILNK